MTEQEASTALDGYNAILERVNVIIAKLEALQKGERCASEYTLANIEDGKVWLSEYCRGDTDSYSLPLSVLWDTEWDKRMDAEIITHEITLDREKQRKAEEIERAERETYEALKEKYERVKT